MAYFNKYKFTFATRANKTAYLYLQEDLATAPTVIEYQGTNINLQYIPNSDDPFEPIFASQLGVTIDITDNITNIPNVVTLNDRKYFARLFLDSTLEWCGWVLSDSIQIGYSTGRKMMSFNATDGMGMLNDIPFPGISSISINNYNTLLYFIYTSLNMLGFPPSNINIMTVCSYFATGMNDRSTNSYNEPFSQTYLPYRTFKKDKYKWINCLDILRNILKSFGCRIFQAGGKWWIVAINDFANENNWYTEYTPTGTVAGSGSNLNTLSVIQGYTGNTSGLYFINNSQLKLIKKGYNKIAINNTIAYPSNYMTNWDLRPLQNPNQPYNWNPATTSTGNSYVITDVPENDYATWVLTRGSTPTSKMTIFNTGLPKVAAGDSLSFSMSFVSGSATNSNGYVQFFITPTSGSVYYMNYDGSWSTNSNNNAIVTTNISYAPFDFSVTSKAFPIDGQLSFGFFLDSTTIDTVEVGNFNLAFKTPLKSVEYTSYLTGNYEYVNNVTIPYGFFSLGLPYSTINPLELGVLLRSNETQTRYWYRYPDTTTFESLQELLTKQYMNIYGKNIINIDCDLSSFSTANGALNASKLFKATDTDPSPINISSNSYMLGNSTTDFAENKTSATLLQISNTNIVCTLTKNYDYEPV
jgi:hypothetical protein